eukprot:g9041.t1
MAEDEELICPLCVEPLDETDRNFKPCKCGYQVCLWCWHNINENLGGKCPACRQDYRQENYEFQAPESTSLERTSSGRIKGTRTRAGSMTPSSRTAGGSAGAASRSGGPGLQRKNSTNSADGQLPEGDRNLSGLSPTRKPLQNVRVLQRNLLYVVGLPLSIAREETLRKKEYFGKFGKIVKIAVNRKHTHSDSNSCSAYVTFKRGKDAMEALRAMNGMLMEGRPIRATFGTTKYCTYFLRGVACNNPGCLYLHEVAKAEDCYTKQDLAMERFAAASRAGMTASSAASVDFSLPMPSLPPASSSSTSTSSSSASGAAGPALSATPLTRSVSAPSRGNEGQSAAGARAGVYPASSTSSEKLTRTPSNSSFTAVASAAASSVSTAITTDSKQAGGSSSAQAASSSSGESSPGLSRLAGSNSSTSSPALITSPAPALLPSAAPLLSSSSMGSLSSSSASSSSFSSFSASSAPATSTSSAASSSLSSLTSSVSSSSSAPLLSSGPPPAAMPAAAAPSKLSSFAQLGEGAAGGGGGPFASSGPARLAGLSAQDGPASELPERSFRSFQQAPLIISDEADSAEPETGGGLQQSPFRSLNSGILSLIEYDEEKGGSQTRAAAAAAATVGGFAGPRRQLGSIGAPVSSLSRPGGAGGFGGFGPPPGFAKDPAPAPTGSSQPAAVAPPPGMPPGLNRMPSLPSSAPPGFSERLDSFGILDRPVGGMAALRLEQTSPGPSGPPQHNGNSSSNSNNGPVDSRHRPGLLEDTTLPQMLGGRPQSMFGLPNTGSGSATAPSFSTSWLFDQSQRPMPPLSQPPQTSAPNANSLTHGPQQQPALLQQQTQQPQMQQQQQQRSEYDPLANSLCQQQQQQRSEYDPLANSRWDFSKFAADLQRTSPQLPSFPPSSEAVMAPENVGGSRYSFAISNLGGSNASSQQQQQPFGERTLDMSADRSWFRSMFPHANISFSAGDSLPGPPGPHQRPPPPGSMGAGGGDGMGMYSRETQHQPTNFAGEKSQANAQRPPGGWSAFS